MPQLPPTQQRLFDRIPHALPLSPVVVLSAGDGMGKSTLLDHLRRHTGGAVLPMGGLLAAVRERPPPAPGGTLLGWAGAAPAGTPFLPLGHPPPPSPVGRGPR